MRAAMMRSQYMGGTPHKGLGLLSVFWFIVTVTQLRRTRETVSQSTVDTVFLICSTNFLVFLFLLSIYHPLFSVQPCRLYC